MVHCNFVDNVLRHGHERLLQDEIILNSDLMADMAASLQFSKHYISTSEIDIGAGYTIKYEGEQKNLHEGSIKCEPSTSPETVISTMTSFLSHLGCHKCILAYEIKKFTE